MVVRVHGKEQGLMNHSVVLLFTGIHNIAVHNLRQEQGVHNFFYKGKGNLYQSITYTYMIYFIQKCIYPFPNIYGLLVLDVNYVQQCYEFP